MIKSFQMSPKQYEAIRKFANEHPAFNGNVSAALRFMVAAFFNETYYHSNKDQGKTDKS